LAKIIARIEPYAIFCEKKVTHQRQSLRSPQALQTTENMLQESFWNLQVISAKSLHLTCVGEVGGTAALAPPTALLALIWFLSKTLGCNSFVFHRL
jgi:hypothetical protein